MGTSTSWENVHVPCVGMYRQVQGKAFTTASWSFLELRLAATILDLSAHTCACICAVETLRSDRVSSMMPPMVATCRTFIPLLWTYLLCAHSGRICVNAFTESAQLDRNVRRLQETTLIDASQVLSSGGVLAVGSPPVDSTIYGASLAAGWAVKAKGSGGVRQQQVAGTGNDGSQAFCATLPAEGVSHSLPMSFKAFINCKCLVYKTTLPACVFHKWPLAA